MPARNCVVCCRVLVDVAAYLGKQPFANPSISRSLTLEDIKTILDSVRAPPPAAVFLSHSPADVWRGRVRVDVSG